MRPPAASRARLIFAGAALLFTASARAQDGYIFTTLPGRIGPPAIPNAPLGRQGAYPPAPLAIARSGDLYVLSNFLLLKVARTGEVTTLMGRANPGRSVDGSWNAGFGPARALAAADSSIMVADGTLLRQVSLIDETVTTIAGSVLSPGTAPRLIDGAGADARFIDPNGAAMDNGGNLLLTDGHAIRRVTFPPATASASEPTVVTFAGSKDDLAGGYRDGDQATARFNTPAGITVDGSGNIYVFDWGNAVIRRISPAGAVTTVAGLAGNAGIADGRGSEARFCRPSPIFSTLTGPDHGGGIAADAAGNIYIADTMNARIRKMTADGVVTTIGGGDRAAWADGFGRESRFYLPSAIVVDQDGVLYIVDSGNFCLRKGTPAWRPHFSTHPQSQSAAAGQTLTLSASTTGTPAPALQWLKDGAPIAGATGSTLTLANFQPDKAGSYAVVATNGAGSATSGAASLTIGANPPVITTLPTAQTLQGGETLTLSVVANGATTVQWLKDGIPIPGATAAMFSLLHASVSDAGNYSVVLTNAAGSVTSAAVAVVVNASRIVNLSIRSSLSPSAPMLTVGFVISGSGKRLLVRGIGPGLAQFGLGGTLEDPTMTLYAGDRLFAANDNWGAAPNALQISATATQVGAFALGGRSADSALLSDFDGGGYSAQISGANGTNGVILVELYDASPDSRARLINVSTRAQVGTGDEVLVAGFVIAGNARKTLLIRAAGPTLASFGVAGTLPNPRLEVIPIGAAAPIAVNDDWGGTAELAAAFTGQGAFPFSSADSKDAALLITLEPGNYSAQVSGVGGAIGEALVEIYDVR